LSKLHELAVYFIQEKEKKGRARQGRL